MSEDLDPNTGSAQDLLNKIHQLGEKTRTLVITSDYPVANKALDLTEVDATISVLGTKVIYDAVDELIGL